MFKKIFLKEYQEALENLLQVIIDEFIEFFFFLKNAEE